MVAVGQATHRRFHEGDLRVYRICCADAACELPKSCFGRCLNMRCDDGTVIASRKSSNGTGLEKKWQT